MADERIRPSEIYRNITREGMLQYLARHGFHAVGFGRISTNGTMYVETAVREHYDDRWIQAWPFDLRSIDPLIIVERNR